MKKNILIFWLILYFLFNNFELISLIEIYFFYFLVKYVEKEKKINLNKTQE